MLLLALFDHHLENPTQYLDIWISLVLVWTLTILMLTCMNDDSFRFSSPAVKIRTMQIL